MFPNESPAAVGKADGPAGPSAIFRGSDGKLKRAVFADRQARNRWMLEQQRRVNPKAYAQSMQGIRDSGRSKEILGKAMPRGMRDMVPDKDKQHIRQNLGDAYALRKTPANALFPLYVASPHGEAAARFTAREFGRSAARAIAVSREHTREARGSIHSGRYWRSSADRLGSSWPRERRLGMRAGLAWTDEMPADRAARQVREQNARIEQARSSWQQWSTRIPAENAEQVRRVLNQSLRRAKRVRRAKVAAAAGATAAAAGVTAAVVHRSRRKTDEVLSKADEVVDLPIPEWARVSFAPGPVPVLSPLDQHAAGRMMAFGGKRARGEVIWPWMRGRMARGGVEQVQAVRMIGSDAGRGRRQS